MRLGNQPLPTGCDRVFLIMLRGRVLDLPVAIGSVGLGQTIWWRRAVLIYVSGLRA